MGIAELIRNAVSVLPEGALEEKLRLGRPLRVKLGVDPTSPDVHLGFAVVLRKLAAFQREGHIAVLIVGDYTARIGDPSGLKAERQVLPGDVLDANAKVFAEQAFRILDPDRTEVRFNGEWLGTLDYAELVRLTRIMTVARLLERDDFARRFAEGSPISLSELLYPLAQGYDSVAVDADVEIGGTDQLFNLLAGRDVMEAYGKPPQVAMTFPLLVGTDGVEKMSKSLGNYVGISEPPEEMFGKVMSIPDEALPDWWRLCLDVEPTDEEPMESKLALARDIVETYHGEDAARRAEEHFTRVVRQGEAPEEVPEVSVEAEIVHLPQLLAQEFGETTSHWRRVVDQGGVSVDGRKLEGYDVPVEELEGAVLQAGKRRFLRVRRSA
ncbi:MAG TPA: tyrosine--tRNA ligase [Gaiellaceae bacterium]|jgi:tyrosyl-tRNA synthetase|nr:tyrosine--tRNA ligase [Gaiellaceae bacterium]